ARLYDGADLLREAARRAPSSPTLREASLFCLYGFYDMNPLQRELARACLQAVPRAAVFFPWAVAETGAPPGDQEDHPALAFAQPLKEWLLGLGLEPVPLPEGPEDGQHAFREVRRRLFRRRGRDGVSDLGELSLAIVAAPGEAREAYELGREIWRLAEEEGVRFEEMAVLLRTEEPYGRLLRETLEFLEIPYRFAGGPPLAESRMARRFRLFLELGPRGLRRRDVLRFFALAPPEGGPEVAPWEELTREAGIVGGAEGWEKGLRHLSQRLRGTGEEGSRSAGSRQGAIEGLRRQAEALFQALATIPESGTPAALARAVLAAFKPFEPPGPTLDVLEKCLRGWEPLEVPELSLEEFAGWVGRLLERTAGAEGGAASRGGVTIARLMDARGTRFRAVLLPGLGAGRFPSLGRQDPLLPDEARRAMDGDSEHGLPLLPLKGERWAEERLLFWLALGAAREHLVLSYPSRDPLQGREKLPSLFLLHLASALGAPMTEEGLQKLPGFRRASAALERCPRVQPASLLEHDQRLIQAALEGREDVEGALAPLLEESATLRRAFEAESARWASGCFTRFDGLLAGSRARESLAGWLGLPPHRVSPTALETYWTCPFQYFLERVLELEASEEPEELYSLPSDELGRLYHRALRIFFERCARDVGLLPLAQGKRETLLSLLREAAEAAFREQEEVGLTGYPLVWERTRQEVWEALRSLLDREIESAEDFIPFAFEEEIEVELPEAGLLLRGRIDRLERSSDGKRLRLLDYKTGRHRGEKDDSLAWTKDRKTPSLQAPLYLLAAKLCYPEAEVEGAILHFFTRKGEGKKVSFSARALQEKRPLLLRFAQAAADGWREGRFFPHPLEGACARCDFKAVCGAAIEEGVARKRDSDPYLRAFLKLRDEANG
ncbi:MAG: PD-(D/E)XK nuclease family protein, partial [Nitrospinota bacterium]